MKATLLRSGAALAMLAVVVACSTDDSESETSETRSYTHELGTIEIPADPKRVVALDEYAALAAHTLDVDLAHVFGSFGSQISATILSESDIEVERLDNFQPPDPETVLNLEPDLVIATGGTELQELYDRIAPAVPVALMPYYGATWEETLESSGEIFDRANQTDSIRDDLLQRADSLSERLDDPPPTVSVVGSTGGELIAPANETPISTILETTGFERPDAQDASAAGEDEQVLGVSGETLDDHDADLFLVPSGAYYDADAVRSVPTYPQLAAVQDGRVFEVDGDMWFGNFAFAIDWMLTDLELLEEQPDQADLGTPDDALQRWRSFRERLE